MFLKLRSAILKYPVIDLHCHQITNSYTNLTAITQQHHDVRELSMRSMICLWVVNEKSIRLIEALWASQTNPLQWNSTITQDWINIVSLQPAIAMACLDQLEIATRWLGTAGVNPTRSAFSAISATCIPSDQLWARIAKHAGATLPAPTPWAVIRWI